MAGSFPWRRPAHRQQTASRNADEGGVIPDPQIIIVALVFFAASVLAGAAGFGLPALAIGTLASIQEPRIAIATAVFPILLTGLRQLSLSGGWKALRQFWLLAVVMTICLSVTADVATRLSAAALASAIAVALFLFSTLTLANFASPGELRMDALAQSLTGISSGVIGGLSAVWSPPLRVYLRARGLDEDQAASISAWFLCLGSVVLAAVYWRAGLLAPPTAVASLLMCGPTFAGLVIGKRLAGKFPVRAARAIVYAACLLAAGNLVRQLLC